MFVSFRPALLVTATLTAASVAPAKVGQQVEPLIEQGSSQLPVASAVSPLSTEGKAQLPVVVETPATNSDDLSESRSDEMDSVDRGASLATKVAQLASAAPGTKQLECLAGAIYFESKSESLQGQLAVGHVIANRANSGRFPSSYCGVVFQRSQFSFVRGGSMPYIPRASQQWKRAVAIAKIVDGRLQASPVGKALFFHARRVSPGWHLTRISTLGNHVFYR